MKIGIVTFVKAENYGAELQAYALQRKLNIIGYDAEVLDLEKEQGVMSSSKRNILMSLKSRIKFYGVLKGIFKFCQAVLETLLQIKNARKFKEISDSKHKIFESFFERKITHSKQHMTLDDLYRLDLPYDVYIAGSDQIWNHMQTNRLDVYFLEFANRFRAKKISYAASFSVSFIPNNLKNKYKKLLNNLDSISVRENNAVDLVRDISGKSAVQVLDPTLLLDRNQWVCELSPSHYLSSKDRIVLIYTLSGSKYIFKLAKFIAQKLGAEVVNIKSDFCKVKGDEGITHITDAGPEEFISLFDKAVYVITDSFHGTAFSINFNIPFTTLLNPVSNMNSRALSILNMCDLSNRIIYDDGNDRVPSTLEVDFSDSNKIIEKWRQLSIEFLVKSLDNN